MPISRHFEIIYILLQKKTATAAELAERLEVSTRTIYRDIDLLSAAGIPIYSSKGKGGGISLMEGYAFQASLLSSREQNDILMGLQTLKLMPLSGTEEVLEKLAGLFWRKNHSWLEVDFTPWGSEDDRRQMFERLRDAIAENRVIRFRYYNSAGKESSRKVEAFQLIFKSNAWYLSGYCLTSEDFRLFKISRMRDIVVTDQTSEPRAGISAVEHIEEQVGSDMTAVTLRISARGAYRIYDEFPDDVITKNEDGSYTIRTYFPVNDWLESYLLSYGTLLEEIHPESLRSRLLSRLDELKRKWASNP
ncbi:transcriptional regulator [Paenibacillus yonginensis]|uniref:Transcriptional regulator n=1 Tax=Paenibacillus yonginensis TaxID=1462996 RepID=A0A1B1MXI8_9BACL|nr:YafY family protein [Paenibacillus yonginensis]ANS73885.1 transcriptional regulator [Paenibacillus yonginensis]